MIQQIVLLLRYTTRKTNRLCSNIISSCEIKDSRNGIYNRIHDEEAKLDSILMSQINFYESFFSKRIVHCLE